MSVDDALERVAPHVFSDTVQTRLVPPRHGDASGVRGAARLYGYVGDEAVGHSIEAVTRSDEDKLSTSLVRLRAEDPSLRIEHNAETGQVLFI